MSRSAPLLLGLLLLATRAGASRPDLHEGESQEHSFREPIFHQYGVELETGDYARVRVTQEGADVQVAVTSPRGDTILTVDSPGDRFGFEIASVIAQAQGVYTFEVQPRTTAEAAVGGYRIELEILRQATPDDRLRVATEEMSARAYFLSQHGLPEDFAESVTLYRRVLQVWQSIGDVREEASTQYRIGMAQFLGNQPQEAFLSFARSLELWRGLEDEREIAKSLNQVARCCMLQGDTRCALDAFQESISLANKTRAPDLEAVVLHNLARLYISLGDLSSAEDACRRALEIYQRRGDLSGESLLLIALAGIFDLQGKPVEATEAFERARELASRWNQLRLEGDALSGLGGIYLRLGQPFEALERFLPALDRYGEGFYFSFQAVVQVSLGALLADLGEAEASEDLLRKSLPVLRDPRDKGRALLVLSRIARDRGAFQDAVELANQALAIEREMDHPAGEAAALRELGFLLLDRQDAQQGKEMLQQALELFEKSGSLQGQAETLRGLGVSWADLGDLAASDRLLDQALGLARELKDAAEEARILQTMASSQQSRKNLTIARARFEEALNLLESIRSHIAGDDLRASHFAAQRQVYEGYVRLLGEMARAAPGSGLEAQAFEAAERARARGLLDFLGQARVDLREGDPALLAEENRLRLEMNAKAALRAERLRKPEKAAELAEIDRDLTALTTQYQILEARLKAGSPRYARLRQPEIDLARIQREVLDGETVLLEYFLTEPRSVLWLVTPESVASFELPGQAEIEALARRVHERLGSPSPEGVAEERKDLAELSRLLLGPALDRITGKRLAVAPDGALWYVPFAALPVPGPEGEVPLVVEHEVVEIPSAAVLRELRRERSGRPRPAGAVAVVADPVFETGDARLQAARAASPPPAEPPRAAATLAQAAPASGDAWNDFLGRLRAADQGAALARLPWTRREAEAVAQEASPRQVLLALDFQASRDLATGPELASYNVLHFATHGLLDTRHPQLSGLALSQVDESGRPRDGFLRLQDVYQMRLAADLVVLSGCETALGKELRGEGIIGLTHGFFHAGATQVMASLWPVRDRATAELMQRFYRGLFHDGLRPAAALRQAQIEMWRERRWRDPFYWAAFVLQGDWQGGL